VIHVRPATTDDIVAMIDLRERVAAEGTWTGLDRLSLEQETPG